MPQQLLPASAAAFAPRASSVNVVLGSKVQPWLTQTLKRINKVKRPLNSVPQHQRCLTETLSSPNAIWTLASLILPKAPESELRKDPNLLVEAVYSHQMIYLEAYIVHVDMVLRNEVAYKLTPETIEALIEYHKDVHCVDAKASTYDWAEKEQQCKKLHEAFVQAINKFVFRTHVSALEGLEEDGVGELLGGKSEDVKNSVMGLIKPLLPPPPPAPRIVEIRQPPLLPSSPAAAVLWSQASPPATLPAPIMDLWKMLPSSPAITMPQTTTVTTTADSSAASLWASIAMADVYLPSPPPQPFSQPYSTASLYYSAPLAMAPLPALRLLSMLAPPCSNTLEYDSFGGWDNHYQERVTIMPQSPPAVYGKS